MTPRRIREQRDKGHRSKPYTKPPKTKLKLRAPKRHTFCPSCQAIRNLVVYLIRFDAWACTVCAQTAILGWVRRV